MVQGQKSTKISRLVRTWFKSQKLKLRDDVGSGKEILVDNLALEDGEELKLRTKDKFINAIVVE